MTALYGLHELRMAASKNVPSGMAEIKAETWRRVHSDEQKTKEWKEWVSFVKGWPVAFMERSREFFSQTAVDRERRAESPAFCVRGRRRPKAEAIVLICGTEASLKEVIEGQQSFPGCWGKMLVVIAAFSIRISSAVDSFRKADASGRGEFA